MSLRRLFRAFSSAPFRHAELNPAAPNQLLRLSQEEAAFSHRLGFTVDESTHICSETDGSIVAPHFIIQTLTHKSYRDGSVPSNDKLVLLGKAFFETIPISEYIENRPEASKLSIKDISLDKQPRILQRGIEYLNIPAVARWDITRGISNMVSEETFYAALGALILRKGTGQARAFIDQLCAAIK